MKNNSLKLIAFIVIVISIGRMTRGDLSYGAPLNLMAYNVENLFDSEHDEGKKDHTYLPLSFAAKKSECLKIKIKRYQKECLRTDWTPKHLEFKLDRILEVLDLWKISQKNKKYPEILALSEIENVNVIKKLAVKLGYKKFVVSNSADKRGIDLAILYNSSADLKFISQKELVLTGRDYKGFKDWPTRNILEVQFLTYKSQKLYIFVNHWPSLANPVQSRLAAANLLRSRILELKKEDTNAHFLAVGDFNTIDSNFPHPFRDVLFKDGLLEDLDTAFQNDRTIEYYKKRKLPPGTYFYPPKMSWNKLDRIFFGAELKDNKGLEINVASYGIFSSPKMTHDFTYDRKGEYLEGSKVTGVPKSYKHKLEFKDKFEYSKQQGYSDHFPIHVQIFKK